MPKLFTSLAFKLFVLFCLTAVFVLAIIIIVKNTSSMPVYAVYEGTLPGADCAGLKTRVTLYIDKTFMLKETYIATKDGDKTYYSKGKWVIVKSRGRDILRLQSGKPEQDYCFLVVEGKYIEPVGKDLNDIETPMDLRLKRLNP